eukprot:g20368.t1
MAVYVRRPETSKFHRWTDGVVEAVDATNNVVYVRRGQTVTSYPFRDVAVEKRITGEQYEMELYPDPDLADLIASRGGSLVLEGEEENEIICEEVDDPNANFRVARQSFHMPRKSVFTRMGTTGTSTHRSRSVGQHNVVHTCERCGRQFTSRNRLLQHLTTTCESNQVSVQYQARERENVVFDRVLPDRFSSMRSAASSRRSSVQYPAGSIPSVRRTAPANGTFPPGNLRLESSYSSDSAQGGAPPSWAAAFAAYSTTDLPESEREVVLELGEDERLFTDGILHERVREAVQRYRTSVNLAVHEGKIFLSTAVETPSPVAERSFDFDVLPKVTSFMEREKCRDFTSKLQRGNNDLCFTFSQLLNGCCIKDKLSPKNPGSKREVHYVAVEVGLFKNKVRGNTPKGRHCYLRWGREYTPQFCTEEMARREVDDTFVARIFFETCDDALEAIQLYTSGVKSSLIVVRLEDAVRLGFAMFAYAACVLEIQAIDKNGVLGERRKLKDLVGENVVTARWLLAIKVERVSGRFTKCKARWITHGFKDVRYHRSNGTAPDSRCYTVGDATILCMLHFNQSVRSHTDLADIAEAFLKGKKLSQLYAREADQRVFMKVPADILELHVPNVEPLDEAIRLNKELYGQKGAPRGWETEWWDANRTTGLRQSFLDPSLWIYHLNEQERLAVQGGYAKKYFQYKLTQILTVPAENLRERVTILELNSNPTEVVMQQPRDSRGLLNPMSIELHNQLLPHCQRAEPPAGMLGTHVDDTLSGGKLLFYLRLICLYEHFGLGSFTRLQCGVRDNFVGRELAMVPYAVDQWRVKAYLDREEDMVLMSGLELDERAVDVFSEEELAVVEARTGVKRDVDPSQYTEATARAFDPWMFLDDEMLEPVVIYVSQQSYAQKIDTVSDEEVNTYFRRRVGANKWAKKSGDIRSPIRAKLGELIWLEKTNSCIVERLGDLASDAHYAEMATSADEIDLFLDELNNLVLLAQLPNMNVIRVYRIAELGEHHLGGGADASQNKVGGSTFLAGEHCGKLGTISRFGGGKPGRVFHSSTGIETLSQKLLVSESVFLAQVTFDMFLCRINRPLLSITDAKNLMQEPKERNLRPDYHTIAMLVRERLLVIAHGPGDRFWADGLTKEPRFGHLFLLHLCMNFGLVDRVMFGIIQTHIKRIVEVEDEQR